MTLKELMESGLKARVDESEASKLLKGYLKNKMEYEDFEEGLAALEKNKKISKESKAKIIQKAEKRRKEERELEDKFKDKWKNFKL